MELHKLPCRSMSLYAVPWAYMKFHELAWSSMSWHEVPWAGMQFHELVCSSFLCLSSSQEFCSACYEWVATVWGQSLCSEWVVCIPKPCSHQLQVYYSIFLPGVNAAFLLIFLEHKFHDPSDFKLYSLGSLLSFQLGTGCCSPPRDIQSSCLVVL